MRSQGGGVPEQPLSLCTYLCLSLMSTGLHAEPYRVSRHCRRVPAGSASSPRAASEVGREQGPPVGHRQQSSCHVTGLGHRSCLMSTEPRVLQSCLSGPLGMEGVVKGGTPKQRSFAFLSLF